MKPSCYASVITHRHELNPIDTGMEPKLQRLPGIAAVIFDIYGTLIVSGTGDVGSVDEGDRGKQIGVALEAAEIEIADGRVPTIEDLHDTIRTSNESRRSEECPKPEVDIVEIWRDTLARCAVPDPPIEQVHRLSAEYEARANPTWPMPGAKALLTELSRQGKRLGIVSNAQGFTLPLVEDLDGVFGVDSVFDMNLCVFSYRYQQAKPGPRLFDVLCEGLSGAGIAPGDAIYVGNDRLNDVWAASQAGMWTAWFAGDRRSMRPRQDDPRVAQADPDVVLTQLDQLVECI